MATRVLTSQADFKTGVFDDTDADLVPGSIVLRKPGQPLTFVRATTAYDRITGALVASGTPRYETGRFGQAILAEEGIQNLIPYSDPTTFAGVVYSGTTIAAAGAVDARFAGGFVVSDNSVTRYAYTQPTLVASTTYLLSAYVRMDDGGAPVIGTSSASGDFGLVLGGIMAIGDIAVVALGGGLYRVSATRTTTTTTKDTGIAKYTTQSARTFKCSGFQLEQTARTIPTSYFATNGAAGTRNAEVITFPTTGISPSSPFTIEVLAYIDAMARRQVTGQSNRLLNITRTVTSGTNYGLMLFHANAAALWVIDSYADDNTYIEASFSDSLTPDGWHRIKITSDGSMMRVYVDEILATTLSLTKKPSAFATGYLGSDGSVYFLNTIYDELRLSNIARTDSPPLDQPLGVDDNTVAYWPLDTSLEPGYDFLGTWTERFDFACSCEFRGLTLTGNTTGITYRARSSEDEVTWTDWVANALPARGRHLDVELTFTTANSLTTPTLESLTLYYTGQLFCRSSVKERHIAMKVIERRIDMTVKERHIKMEVIE